MSEPLPAGEYIEGHAGSQTIRREMEERERLMRNRVSEAIRGGHFWAIVRAELARDYSSLFDNVWRLERQIDQHFADAQREPQAHAGSGRR